MARRPMKRPAMRPTKRPMPTGGARSRPNLGRKKGRPALGAGLKRRVKSGSMSVRKARRIQSNRMKIRRRAR